MGGRYPARGVGKRTWGVGKVVKQTGKGVAVGRVLRTSPKAGAHKRNGVKVKLFVRK